MQLLTELEEDIFSENNMANSDVLFSLIQRCKVMLIKKDDRNVQDIHDACQAALSLIECLHERAANKSFFK